MCSVVVIYSCPTRCCVLCRQSSYGKAVNPLGVLLYEVSGFAHFLAPAQNLVHAQERGSAQKLISTLGGVRARSRLAPALCQGTDTAQSGSALGLRLWWRHP